MRLTIAIPTFNRNDILLENVRLLLPQLTQECRLLIIDNCSDVPVSRTLQAVLSDYPDTSIEIMRNKVNIGANANILRCFEMCETEWLWVLGDDDTPKPNAIEIILGHIRLYPECIYFNFLAGYSTLRVREQTIITRGIEEFVEKVDVIANVLFLSSGVHRASVMNRNLRFAYAYAHTQPNFIPLLTSLGKEGVCYLSTQQIVTYNPPPASEQRWSVLYFGLGIMTLLELPLDSQTRQKLAKKILESMPWLKMFVLQLLLMAIRDNDYRSALYLYDQLCYRLYYFDTDKPRKAKIFIYRIMLRFPHISYSAIRLLKGRKTSKHILQDRFGRV